MHRKKVEIPADVLAGLHRVAHARDEATACFVLRQLLHVLAMTDEDAKQPYWRARAAALEHRKPRRTSQPTLVPMSHSQATIE